MNGLERLLPGLLLGVGWPRMTVGTGEPAETHRHGDGQFPPLAGRQSLQRPVADPAADQAQGRMADGGGHPPNLTERVQLRQPGLDEPLDLAVRRGVRQDRQNAERQQVLQAIPPTLRTAVIGNRGEKGRQQRRPILLSEITYRIN